MSNDLQEKVKIEEDGLNDLTETINNNINETVNNTENTPDRLVDNKTISKDQIL